MHRLRIKHQIPKFTTGYTFAELALTQIIIRKLPYPVQMALATSHVKTIKELENHLHEIQAVHREDYNFTVRQEHPHQDHQPQQNTSPFSNARRPFNSANNQDRNTNFQQRLNKENQPENRRNFQNHNQQSDTNRRNAYYHDGRDRINQHRNQYSNNAAHSRNNNYNRMGNASANQHQTTPNENQEENRIWLRKHKVINAAENLTIWKSPTTVVHRLSTRGEK
ncbi:putative uncharacterized protein DDB_G0279653 [Nilaparvata lugens]|uniref:putative uncharacterized protein DDB_G0279653 n=1 Tax=Nilaparvata lugens TaxID=108931 RepID=UPI00193EBEA5|nr:putative uncharacterized protein DDB_G0279653 [Nilaparvata lugens]